MKTTGALLILVCLPAGDALAQQERGGDTAIDRTSVSAPTEAYKPVTGRQRIEWIVDGVVGPRSLGIGVWSAAWQTEFNSPKEWGRSWGGFGKRYLARESDVALSNTIEAGIGAFWGEEARYVPSHRRGIWPRARFAAKTVFLAQRPDGHLAPAWGRYIGNTVNNVFENAWLPPSATTPGQTALRSVDGMLSRLVGNLWDEFWPEARKRLVRRRRTT